MRKNLCPVCHVTLDPALVAGIRFRCPSCATRLRLAYSRLYAWTRALVCLGAALAYLWKHGYRDSFIVFIVSFLVLPALWLWDAFVPPLYPPDRIVPVQGPIVTLDLQQ